MTGRSELTGCGGGGRYDRRRHSELQTLHCNGSW